MELRELLNKPLPKMSSEMIDALRKSQITKTTFEDKNKVLTNSDLQAEVGYIKYGGWHIFLSKQKMVSL